MTPAEIARAEKFGDFLDTLWAPSPAMRWLAEASAKVAEQNGDEQPSKARRGLPCLGAASRGVNL